jgi:hypothetical protein
MKQQEHKWLDIDEKVEKAGIDMPVNIEPALLEKLEPSPYLASLGVTLEQRIENLLSLLKANLHTETKTTKSSGGRYYLPFMILKGPLVVEDFFPVIAHIIIGDENRPSITLTEARDSE